MLVDDEVPLFDRSALSRTYVFGNGKGGVGKTTLTSNIGGLAAEATPDASVLLVDVNGQGNIGRDLGYRKTGRDDEGEAMYEALRHGTPLVPIKDVRPGLDVVVGGRHVSAVPDMLQSTYRLAQRRQALALAISLAPIAGQYDLIGIDSAPENPPLQQLALAAARWLIAPTRTDRASINDGLGSIALQFDLVRRTVNPDLELLGVVLFGSGQGSTSIRRRALKWIAEELETDESIVFETFIRYAEGVGVDARARGMLAHELERAVADNPRFWDIKAGRATSDHVVSATSGSVAEDLSDLAREVFLRAAEWDRAA
ncbi:ParA family protein [Streptomyces sp. NBC_01237]|uniref:ParA family protein n=1 Tax=Streptomyces sp. NBC_01237 TaxID=2903790 RepID=UPI002DDA3974|nr:ParA family protein [Streptomyces sp. NBC_01237]WRZ78734.1 ParA family protein [Streptomyces sp. NBC_01237]